MTGLTNDWLATAPGAQDFAEVYRSVGVALRDATVQTIGQEPGFARFAQQLNAGDPDAAYEHHRAGIQAALAGDWAAHEAALRVLAPRCASLGVSLADWRLLMDRTGTIVRDALFARFADEPARLKDAVVLMSRFYDQVFATFTEAYVGATHEELQQSEALFQLTTIGHVVVAQDGSFVRANDAFQAMYGIPKDALRTRTLKSLFAPSALPHIARDVFPQALANGRASYDSVHLRADGTEFPVHIEAVRISGKELWGHSIVDLSDREQMETLRARSAELEAENQRVNDASRLKSEFLANMSHELRTPLNAILGFSELLEAGEVGPLQEQQREFVHDIHTSGVHLLKLINDVLDLSKVEAGKLEFDPEPFDLDEVTREAVQLTRVSANERSIAVWIDVDEPVRQVRLDRVRYQQVLYNYLSNAIKFSPPHGAVHVRVAPEGDAELRLAVRDQGAGIPADSLGRLFQTFEQLDSGRAKKHAGTGLGLALTRRIVEAQGGRVGVDSVVGQGSTFWAVLPRRAA